MCRPVARMRSIWLAVLVGCHGAAAVDVDAAADADVVVVDPTAHLRVNQVGFGPGAPKRALLMTGQVQDGVRFQVVGTDGTVAFRGLGGADRGPWSAAFPHVYPLDFTALATPGAYRVEAVGQSSPAFQIANDLYAPLAADAVTYLRANRDGEDVDPSLLSRAPSHLLDRTAATFAPPTYDPSETLIGALSPLGGTVDASGGWFDAGDYLKFVETASYVEVLLLVVARDRPSPALLAEARRGLDWLLRMWDDPTRTLYYQVGIGAGNASTDTDHDVWRLPEADDAQPAPAGDRAYYIAHRPVFRAGPPGSKISGNLAGRLAAAFALGSLVFPSDSRLLPAAKHVYDLADPVAGVLLTASPHGFYPESSRTDDLELGGAELYFALAASDPTAASGYLAKAAGHATSYDTTEPLNLYMVGGLAHVELARAIAQSGATLPITHDALIAKTVAILDAAVEDPFGFGAAGQGDPVPHALGLAALAQLVGSHAELAQHQLDWALGANAWGTTFVVGAGTTFPHCLQHQVANLVGALDGTTPILRGATVDGPADLTGAANLGVPAGAKPCAITGFDAFDGTDPAQHYTDRVEVYATVEPADDYTATAFYAWVTATGP